MKDISKKKRRKIMIIDPALIKEAMAAGIENLYDANGDGVIDSKDITAIKAMEVPGITEELGSPEALEQFEDIEVAAQKTGFYKGKSLAWGAGGRSALLKDKLLVQGYSAEDADTIVKQNYIKQRYNRIQNNLPV
jgi:hypothetical protein